MPFIESVLVGGFSGVVIAELHNVYEDICKKPPTYLKVLGGFFAKL